MTVVLRIFVVSSLLLVLGCCLVLYMVVVMGKINDSDMIENVSCYNLPRLKLLV